MSIALIQNGIININKPSGISSSDVVLKVKQRLGVTKAGHTGTLDPLATGVLPVCIGRSTRIIEYYQNDIKSYIAEFKFGFETDTLDTTGNIIKTSDTEPNSSSKINDALASFQGEISQYPPMYSALKFNGKRLYEYARAGEKFDIPARTIRIFDLKLLDYDSNNRLARISVSCSKGTYIRALIRDIAYSLGTLATMTALTRTESGYFKLEDSITLDTFLELPSTSLEAVIIKESDSLELLGEIELSLDRAQRFVQGNSSYAGAYEIIKKPTDSEFYKVFYQSAFLGIGEIDEQKNLIVCKVLGKI